MPGDVREGIKGMRVLKGGKTDAFIFCQTFYKIYWEVGIVSPLILIDERLSSEGIAFDSETGDDTLGNRSCVRVMPESLSRVDIANMHFNCGNI